MKQLTKRLLAFLLCAAMFLALLPTQTSQAKAYASTDIANPIEGGKIEKIEEDFPAVYGRAVELGILTEEA